MNPLSQRLSSVELELAELQEETQRLSQTVHSLRKEVQLEEAATVSPIPQPPVRVLYETPAPEPQPEPQPKRKIKSKPPAIPNREDAAKFEMQLGRIWFVRLGILLLTTGFVFLSRYTYDNFVHDLGPGIRLTMMYVLSFLLTGAGLFFERWKDSLKSYGRIVAAGGLAAIYYCGFAAHNVDALRVIENPVTASVLLTLSAALFCAVSLWRESRVMLSASLALAFYSISVNPVGWAACISAVILAAFGVTMMIRYRWVEVGFVVLLGSYLSFFWWQIAVTQSDHAIGRWFLVAYWILFTVAAFTPRLRENEARHALFTSFNNTAFFFLFSFQFEAGNWMNQHWLFCLIFGSSLISLGFFSKSHFPEKTRFTLLLKGLGILTLGLALHLNGHHLFIAMLVEALVLMALNFKKPHLTKEAIAWVIAVLSFLSLKETQLSQLPNTALFFGSLAWFTFGILNRLTGSQGHFVDPKKLHPGGLVATLIGTVFLSVGVMSEWNLDDRVLVMTFLGFIASLIALSPKARSVMNDSIFIFIVLAVIMPFHLLAHSTSTISTQLSIASLAFLTSLSPVLNSLRADDPKERNLYHLAIASFLVVSIIFLSLALLQSSLSHDLKLIIILSISFLGSVAARSSGLFAHSLVPFGILLSASQLPLFDGSLLLIGLLFTTLHFRFVLKSHHLSDRHFLLLSLYFIGIACWGFWLVRILDQPALPLVLSGIGLLSVARKHQARLTSLSSILFFIAAFAYGLLSNQPLEIHLCLIAPLAFHLFYNSKEDPIRYQTLGTISLLLLWTQITRDASSLPLAAVWALMGTLTLLAGLALKSRCFRLLALIILTFSLGHLMIFDLIKLNPLPRILSFMTLGLGLLGLGFVYNRYQDRLKEIL